MKLLQLPIESLDQVSKLFGIAALVLFGCVMLFLGWLKYKDRDSPKVNTPRKRAKRKAKRK
jgi:hypothetical protein